MLRWPRRGSRFRWLGLGFGLALLLWMSVEDQRVVTVTLLGTGLSALTVIAALLGRFGGQAVPAAYGLSIAAVSGIVAGLGASLATAALMLFKNALHAHVFLDFPPGLMLALLERAPIWGAAGGLIGIGLALVWLAFYRK